MNQFIYYTKCFMEDLKSRGCLCFIDGRVFKNTKKNIYEYDRASKKFFFIAAKQNKTHERAIAEYLTREVVYQNDDNAQIELL